MLLLRLLHLLLTVLTNCYSAYKLRKIQEYRKRGKNTPEVIFSPSQYLGRSFKVHNSKTNERKNNLQFFVRGHLTACV